MNYTEYLERRFTEMTQILNSYYPEFVDQMISQANQLKSALGPDGGSRINTTLKIQLERILGRELHWAELDGFAMVLGSCVAQEAMAEGSLDILGDPTVLTKRICAKLGMDELEAQNFSNTLLDITNGEA